MKKMLLLIVSGLLIACMAGSAMAFSLNLLTGPNLDSPVITEKIPLEIGQEATIYLKVTDDLGVSGTTNFDVHVSKIDPNTFKTIGGTAYLNVTPNPVSVDVVSLSSVVGATPLTIKMLPGATVGDLYRVRVDNTDLEVSVTAHSATIPEFPTVALPVAAILGLVFIFGRKKEEL